MKISITFLTLFLIIQTTGIAQNSWRDGVRQKLANAETDTSRVLAMVEMCSTFKFDRPDSSLFYGYKALTLARNINFTKGEVKALIFLGLAELNLGNELKAFQLNLEGFKIAEKNNMNYDIAILKMGRANYYTQGKEYAKAISLIKESIITMDSINDEPFSIILLNALSGIFLEMNQLDSALNYSLKAYEKSVQNDGNWATFNSLFSLGNVYARMSNTNLSLTYFWQSLAMSKDALDFYSASFAIAQLYQQTEMPDSSIFYIKQSLKIAQDSGFIKNIIDASLLLSNIYETKDIQQAFQYSKQAIAYKDSLTNLARNASQQTFIEFDYKERQREIEEAKTDFQYRLRMNAFAGITFTLLIIAFFLFRSNRLKQKAKQKIESAFNQLKSTQSQLIQSEKMASLGELTAGIAHEIQNPLNFVNNFSEVNSELIDELSEEVDKGNMDEVKAIAKDIKENEQKINHHGKRAADIVKGMLQHSRTSSGVKEPTDINALADEYLRLAYHGLRAKDKSLPDGQAGFNAEFKTEFDPNLPKINVIPQDIGRVLLNLINNAFYAVDKKAKENNDNYKPLVVVESRLESSPSADGPRGQRVKITVKDNGPGIPLEIKDKIFQPFFTTKPTGQGTGLGLSLAYDIVKAHGGELKVETKEGEGSVFNIQIPIN